ncbi:serine hydrolase domain-containing protein [Bradyrhizobium sp. LHD-71]|uniref:serine hydrolase domain-containing protein n=1 Tax=Bradyrhizobium sp. LHD-71 TaxID=3072141 RepID=UPI00280D6D29|nr:serine hydrolase domain-containing protein [Bradyrhizobium sp. LHD-71]MDQ8731789.1 serine hydrolase domain-containing protein [Bradyrhizobium sp. LHD-71]
MRSFAIASALSLLLAAGPVAAEGIGESQPEQLGFSRERLKTLTNFFQDEVTAGKVPGAIVLVQRRGRPAYFEAFGVRDAATKAPMTADTLFRIYSMTKPITSVAALMLVQDGKLSLEEPVAKYIPSFGKSQVGVEQPGEDGKPVLNLVPVRKQMTIQDLLRHTSGITYAFSGHGLVYASYGEQRFEVTRPTNEEFVERIAALPLAHQPGTTWEYSHSTDVLGRVIEVVEGKPLIQVFKERLFDPLGMKDTSFYVTDAAKQALIAEPLANDGGSGANALFNPRIEKPWQSGGGGLISTIHDYARFAQMIVNRGTLDGRRYLSPKIFAWMASNHIGPSTGILTTRTFLPGPGFGFGLGFGVRVEQGASAVPGSIGELYWGGAGGTFFWADPKEEMFAVMMMQSPTQRLRYRNVIKNLVYTALEKPN